MHVNMTVYTLYIVLECQASVNTIRKTSTSVLACACDMRVCSKVHCACTDMSWPSIEMHFVTKQPVLINSVHLCKCRL